MKQRFYLLLAVTIAFTAHLGVAQAQENLPPGPSNYEEDLQIFAPFELDLDNMTDKQWSGYFFDYNKLFWAYTGERTTIGDQTVSENIGGVMVQGQFAEIIYQQGPPTAGGTPGSIGTEPGPYLVHNELNNAGPRAGFAMGNRYEVGYRDQGHGWVIGVLDGPSLNQTTSYGFQPRASDGGINPFIPADYTAGNDVGVPLGTVGTTGPVGDARAFGFGSVPILFKTPPGYLQGFRDYQQNLFPAEGGTVAGPILYVGSYGLPTFNEQTTTGTTEIQRHGDDLNGNGIWGSAIVIDPATGGLATIVDFGDLHTFNVFFDSVTVHSTTNLDGVEAMWTHDLTNQNYMAKNQNNRLTAAYGARFLRLYDDFRVDAFGSILHDAFWDTSFDNQIVGPQVALQWVNERQRWRIESDARFMAGFNIANWNQVGLMGAGLIPGALNEPLYGRPTAFSHGLRDLEFAPVGELRLKASYHFTQAFALNLGYTGTVIANIKRAAPSVNYQLPDMGYVDAGTQTLLSNGFDLGVEFMH
ncbi:MAG TPA: BBP7 family outer membrane beta-barrel protein [Lacipirellulaceae bacterium]|nr:BBP7 family outer membrane beta-barrel protein [Lacipirellulaceae bacterium]